MREVYAVLISIIFLSCQSQNSTKSDLNKDTSSNRENNHLDSIETKLNQSLIIDNYLVDCKYITEDFSIISENCGIFISPDSTEIIKMKKEYGEEDFYVIADDNIFYDYTASHFLDSMGINCLYPKTRYLKFKINKDTICFDTKSRYKTGWLSILYRENSEPEIYNSIDVEQAYLDYFKMK
jgi:hypothetical protein